MRVIKLLRFGGASLKNCCVKIQALKMNIVRTLISRTLHIIFVMPCRGRTEATKTYYRVKQVEKINYVDVIRLYPYICRYGKFPVSHQKVYVGADCLLDCLDREGIMKCKVLPPRKLSSSTSVQMQF